MKALLLVALGFIASCSPKRWEPLPRTGVTRLPEYVCSTSTAASSTCVVRASRHARATCDGFFIDVALIDEAGSGDHSVTFVSVVSRAPQRCACESETIALQPSESDGRVATGEVRQLERFAATVDDPANELIFLHEIDAIGVADELVFQLAERSLVLPTYEFDDATICEQVRRGYAAELSMRYQADRRDGGVDG